MSTLATSAAVPVSESVSRIPLGAGPSGGAGAAGALEGPAPARCGESSPPHRYAVRSSATTDSLLVPTFGLTLKRW